MIDRVLFWWADAAWMPAWLADRVVWSVNNGGPVAWPGRLRCLFRPHSCDGYGDCCWCGRYGWCRAHPHV